MGLVGSYAPCFLLCSLLFSCCRAEGGHGARPYTVIGG